MIEQPMNAMHSPNPLLALLPMLVIWIPMIFVVRALAKEKGKDVILWTVLSCIPFVAWFILPYIVGTPSKIQEEKLDRILELLKNENMN